MAQDDATVRLPGRGDPGQAPDPYGTDATEHGFGSGGPYRTDEGYDDAPVYQPGSVTSYSEEDRTLMLGPDTWSGPAARPVLQRDRLLVHGVWEVLLILLVGGLSLFCYINEPKMFSGSGQAPLMLSAAILGMLAVAVSLSLRAATPNLAVGAFASVAGVLFVRDQGHGTVGSGTAGGGCLVDGGPGAGPGGQRAARTGLGGEPGRGVRGPGRPGVRGPARCAGAAAWRPWYRIRPGTRRCG